MEWTDPYIISYSSTIALRNAFSETGEYEGFQVALHQFFIESGVWCQDVSWHVALQLKANFWAPAIRI